MNVARAIEIALAKVLREHADLGADVLIRPYQSLKFDGSWDENKDRFFPLVAIECQPPQVNDDAATCFCDCKILCGSNTNDDRSHEFIAGLYGEIQRVIDLLLSQSKGTTGAELSDFSATLSLELGSDFNGVGGFEMVAPIPPYDNNGINMIGITLRTHYTRKDY